MTKLNPIFNRKTLAGIFVVVILLSVFVFSHLALANSNVQSLVETEWLAKNLETSNIRPMYVGFISEDDKAKFDSKHIAGSVYLSVGDLMGAMGDGSTPPDKAKFESFMGGLGVSSNTHVVLYGDPAGNPFVPGAFWLMKYFGHTKVSILNGSFAKWNNEGRLVTGEPAKVTAVTYTASSADGSIRADADHVLKNIKNPKVALVDARSEDEFVGKEDRNKRKGHIPGAINLNFYPTNRNADGTYKSVNDLKAVYEAKGVTKDKEVIVYCEGGVRAGDTYFVLKHLLGYPNVRNYVGSWGEWGNRLDPEKYPVAK